MNTANQVPDGHNKLQREKTVTYLERALKLIFQILSILLVETFRSCINLFKATEPKNIEGQLALVSGGGNGLGKEICVELAKRGCNVAVIDIDLPGATKTSETLKKQYGVQSKAYKVDVANFNEIEHLKSKIEKDLGFVDILVNNAGLTPTKALDEYPPEFLKKIVDVNLLSNIWTVKIFLPGMKTRKRGHIVQIASVAGLSGVPIGGVYSATKFGVRGFMESLAIDMAIEDLEECIYTTTVYPYFIATNDELCNFLDKTKSLNFIPAMTASTAARKTVTEFLKNKDRVIIPSFFNFFISIERLHPRKALIAIQKIIYSSAVNYRRKLNEKLKSGEIDNNQNVPKIKLTSKTIIVKEAEDIAEKLAKKTVDNVLGKVVENVIEKVVKH